MRPNEETDNLVSKMEVAIATSNIERNLFVHKVQELRENVLFVIR